MVVQFSLPTCLEDQRLQAWTIYKWVSSIYALKVVGNEKQWGSRRSQMLGNGLGPWWSRFIYHLNTELLNKIIFPFPLSPAKWISDYFDIKRYGANKGIMAHQSSCVNGYADWIRSANYETVLRGGFFLVLTAALFTLRTFGTQIKWRVISRKVLFDLHCFLSN
jgi:hypothetical protein